MDRDIIMMCSLLSLIPLIIFLVLRGPMKRKKQMQKLIEERAAREAERIRWIEEHGTPEEKILLELERQNERLRQLGQAQAMHNLFDTLHRH